MNLLLNLVFAAAGIYLTGAIVHLLRPLLRRRMWCTIATGAMLASTAAQDGHLWHYDQQTMPLNMHQAGTELELAAWRGGTAALLVGVGYSAEAIVAPHTSSDAPQAIRYLCLGTAVYFGGRSLAHVVHAGRSLQVLPDPGLYEPKPRD